MTDRSTYPQRDPALIIRGVQGPGVPDITLGADGADSAGSRLLQDAAPDVQLAALNGVAGKILLSRGIKAATTAQLIEAVGEAEEQLGFRYDDVRSRSRATGLSTTIQGADVPIESGSALLAAKADAYILTLNLGREATVEEYLLAVDLVSK